MATLVLALLLLGASGLAGQAGQAGSAAPGAIKVLVISPMEHRAQAYRDFLQQYGLAGDVVGYDKVTAEDMARHDVILLDSTDATFEQYKQWSKIDFKALPKTDKPIIGMGYYGYFYLRQYELLLGKVKT